MSLILATVHECLALLGQDWDFTHLPPSLEARAISQESNPNSLGPVTAVVRPKTGGTWKARVCDVS